MYESIKDEIEDNLKIAKNYIEEDSLGDMMSYMDRSGYPYHLIGGGYRTGNHVG